MNRITEKELDRIEASLLDQSIKNPEYTRNVLVRLVAAYFKHDSTKEYNGAIPIEFLIETTKFLFEMDPRLFSSLQFITDCGNTGEYSVKTIEEILDRFIIKKKNKLKDSKMKRETKPSDITGPMKAKEMEHRSTSETGGCPLLGKYNMDRFIGKGAFGTVFHAKKKNDDDEDRFVLSGEYPEEYAIKMTRSVENGKLSTENERQVHYWVTQAYSLTMRICNIVKLYDWTICQLCKSDFEIPITSRVESSGKSKSSGYSSVTEIKKPEDLPSSHFDTSKQLFQIFVMEYVKNGTLQTLEKEMGDEFWVNDNFMRSWLLQIVLCLDQLQLYGSFVHADLHPGNILVDKLDEEILEKMTHFYYTSTSNVQFIIPIEDSHDYVYKINDFGYARIEHDGKIYRGLMDHKKILADAKYGEWAPCFDMHKLSCTLVRFLLHQLMWSRVEINQLNPEMIDVLNTCINKYYISSQQNDDLREKLDDLSSLMTRMINKKFDDKNPKDKQNMFLASVNFLRDLENMTFKLTSDMKKFAVPSNLVKHPFFDKYRLDSKPEKNPVEWINMNIDMLVK